MKKRILSIVLTLCMVLMLVPISASAMVLYVDLNITGAAQLTLEVESGDSIDNVKSKIENETGYSKTIQILMYDGQVLQNERTLADYNIQKESTIELSLSSSFEPSVTAYATKEQLKDGTFAPNANGTANNIGKLVFGKKSDGTTPQEWYILGEDSGVNNGENNTIIFTASPIATGEKFSSSTSNKNFQSSFGVYETNPSEVYSNHYGASDLRAALKTMETSNFTEAEQNLMNATTVTTNDTMNSTTYTTTDKLYALAADGMGASYTTIKAGSSDQTVLSESQYLNNEEEFFLLRSPYTEQSDAVLLARPNSSHGFIGYTGVDEFFPVVRPAANLNLTDVLFASAATGGAGSEITSDMPLNLKFDGSEKKIGVAGYDAEKGLIIAQKNTAAEGNVYLIIQGNDGNRDWFYSISVEGTVELTAEQISDSMFGGQTGISLGNCKIWLETNEDGLAYVVNANSNIYSVNLHANGGTINNGNMSAYISGLETTLPADITYDGHTFDGWYDNAAFQGEPITIISTTDYGNKDLYAKWQHPGKTTTTKATIKADGSIVETCSVCEETLSTTIIPRVSGMKLQATNYTYNGGVKTPGVKVVDANGSTVPLEHYKVSYASGRKNVGSYKVTVTFKNESDKYSGSMSAYFNINPKGTSISKVSKAKKAFTVKWKKQSSKMATSRIKGYQIRYSTSPKMTSAKIKNVKGYKSTSKKITKLKAKKKYYVQIRTYQTVGGKTYYSSWSTVKSVKTK